MKRMAALVLASIVLVGGIAALALGGTASDPFITKSYADGVFAPGVVAEAEKRTETSLEKVYDTANASLNEELQALLPESGGAGGVFAQRRVKRGDVLTLHTGAEAVLLAGSASASLQKGALIDLTTGQEVAGGTSLALQHRYLAAEDTTCLLTILSDTAVIAPKGGCTLTESAETDYNALADALKEMGMFRGSGLSYGDGYELERAPTRIEGLILFLRLLGEEGKAFSFTGECPFADVQEWSKPYVGYAYAMGYTKGVGGDGEKVYFNPYGSITALEYELFVLRALGYQDGEGGDFSWEAALTKARELGCLTEGEYELLVQRPFLRAQAAYVSYYALDGVRKTGETLLEHLSAMGSLDRALVDRVRQSVEVKRIG